MSALRPLRGACQCGRNRYIIVIPEDSASEAQVHFNTEPSHQIPLATPLAAYIRVPLAWYHSTTYALFPDETHALIRRVYTHPSQAHAKRHFCGYCGTPLSYWSEQPTTEAEYMNITLGSLVREDLRDLEDMGLIDEEEQVNDDDDDDSEIKEVVDRESGEKKKNAVRQSFGVPWFDSLVEGTRLGKMRRSQGIQRTGDGQVSIEWEIVEFGGDDDDDDDDDDDVEMASGAAAPGVATPSKRKLDDVDTAQPAREG